MRSGTEGLGRTAAIAGEREGTGSPRHGEPKAQEAGNKEIRPSGVAHGR